MKPADTMHVVDPSNSVRNTNTLIGSPDDALLSTDTHRTLLPVIIADSLLNHPSLKSD